MLHSATSRDRLTTGPSPPRARLELPRHTPETHSRLFPEPSEAIDARARPVRRGPCRSTRRSTHGRAHRRARHRAHRPAPRQVLPRRAHRPPDHRARRTAEHLLHPAAGARGVSDRAQPPGHGPLDGAARARADAAWEDHHGASAVGSSARGGLHRDHGRHRLAGGPRAARGHSDGATGEHLHRSRAAAPARRAPGGASRAGAGVLGRQPRHHRPARTRTARRLLAGRAGGAGRRRGPHRRAR